MNTSKIIKGVVGGGRYTVTAPIIKEDYGLYLQIEGIELPATYEVDFSNDEHSGTSVTMIGNSDGVLIPSQFISTGKDIFAFLYHVGEDFGRTVYKFRIPNKLRPDRTDEEPTPEEQSTIDQAISALNTAVAQTAQDVIDADASAQSAAESAESASASATASANSASASAQSATDAQTYATQASQSAQASAQSASQSAQIKADVEDMVDDAQGYADSASQSAQASANSASQAQGYTQSASTSATNAQTYASQADISANTASEKAQDASGYAQTASQKASEASQSATNAQGYAQTAEQAKTDAQTAQGLAESARDLALQAKTDAQTAQAGAETAAQDVSASAAQIQTNKEDIDALRDDLTVVSEKVSAIEEAEGLHKYGVSGIGQSASALTRIWDSVGMTAQVGTDGDNSNVVNNFDDVTPFNRRKCVGHWDLRNGRPHFVVAAYLGDENYTEDGSMGDYVAVECPRAYFYLEGNMLGVSAHHYAGWKPFDIFCRDHNEEDTFEYAYLPAYALALKDGHAVSLPGLDNEQGDYAKLFNAARTYNNDAVKSLAMIEPAAVNFYEWALFTVEFAQQCHTNVMKGCLSLRSNNADTVVFLDATHVLCDNYYASRVAGEYICIYSGSASHTNVAYQATHQIVSIVRCDENGTASASGTHQLIEVTDLGKDYVTYDTTGATTYNLAARPYRTGACNDVSTPSGSPVSNTSGYYPMKYRHRENIYGNQYTTFVDLFNKRVETGNSDYKQEWYYLSDPTKIATPSNSVSLPSDNYVKLDVETPHENYVNGYIKTRKYASDYPNIWIPGVSTGASASTYYAVYAYLVASAPVRSVRFGGYWNSSGAVSLSASYAPSSSAATYGAHLCFAQ